LTEPSADHPLGLAVFVYSATTPSEGLNPEQTTTYLEAVDAQSGQSVSTATLRGLKTRVLAPISADGINLTFEATGSGGGRVYRGDIASGRVSGSMVVPQFTEIYPLGDKFAMMVGSDSCRTKVFSQDLQLIASTPHCGNRVVALMDERGGGNGVLDGSITFTAPLNDGYFRLDTSLGEVDETGYAYSDTTARPAPVRITTSGPRSTLGLNEVPLDKDIMGFSSESLSTYILGSWVARFSLSANRARSLKAKDSGISDNDIWVTTTDQHIVVDGSTGQTVATGWGYSPEYGGPTWTVVRQGGGSVPGQASEYLVTHRGPLADVILNAPNNQ